MKKCLALSLLSLFFILCFAGVVSTRETVKTIHVFVALCDNVNQGIVPVPEKIGDGEKPGTNLYWGCDGGVKGWFKRSKNWDLIQTSSYKKGPILESIVFKHKTTNTYIFAQAYKGIEIQKAIIDFLDAAAGQNNKKVTVSEGVILPTAGGADLIAYIGHNGLMDFELEEYPKNRDGKTRPAIILACKSRQYFSKILEKAGAKSFLLTNGLMAPEAYTLEAAVDGWINGESGQKIRERAATAYDKYQDCSYKAALWLFYAE